LLRFYTGVEVEAFLVLSLSLCSIGQNLSVRRGGGAMS
jgi:hypothetical protein